MDLIEAVENNNIDKVKVLIEAGADLNVKNSYGYTALMGAKDNNNINIYNYLKFHQRIKS